MRKRPFAWKNYRQVMAHSPCRSGLSISSQQEGRVAPSAFTLTCKSMKKRGMSLVLSPSRHAVARSSAATLRSRQHPGSRAPRPTAKFRSASTSSTAGRERRQGTPEAPHQRLQLRGRVTDLHPGPRWRAGSPSGPSPRGSSVLLLAVPHDSLVGRERYGA